MAHLGVWGTRESCNEQVDRPLRDLAVAIVVSTIAFSGQDLINGTEVASAAMVQVGELSRGGLGVYREEGVAPDPHGLDLRNSFMAAKNMRDHMCISIVYTRIT